MLFSGFIWTFLFATSLYYIKWGFCADLTTGEVNNELYGIFSLGASMLMFIPLILGTVIASPLMKAFKSIIRFHRFLIALEFIPCLILFLLQVVGILHSVPMLFFACMIVVSMAIGMDFIPGETINIECMDYEIYVNGKDRSALCNACNKFLNKAQSALSSGLVGVILVAIGYNVDSTTGAFLGELSAIPSMLTWFIVVMGLIPGVMGLISWLVLKQYPVTDEVRTQMRAALEQNE